MLLTCLASPLRPAFAQEIDTKSLEKSKGLVIYLPERGVSAKMLPFQEAKPPRGILKPYLLNDGSLIEIEDSLIQEVVEMNSILPENVITDKENILSKARKQLESLKDKYPRFSQEWTALAKAQEKDKIFATRGYVKHKNSWITALEWDLLQKAVPEPTAPVGTRLTTKDGQTFHKVKLSRIDGSTLIITHDGGIAKITKENLPDRVEPADPELTEAIAKIRTSLTLGQDAPQPLPAPQVTPTQ